MSDACRWCGGIHGQLCPFVKALEFDVDKPDVVVRVEFMTPADQAKPAPVQPPPDDYPKLPRGE